MDDHDHDHDHEHELEQDQQGEREPACEDERSAGSGKRNRYFEGKRLRQASFEVEQAYHVDRRRLLNRAIHGWGVVHGFALDLVAGADGKPGKLTVGAGLALDEAGRELVQVSQQELAPDRVHLSPRDRARLQAQAGNPQLPGRWLLSVHYAETRQGPLRVGDCGCERREWEFLCETVSYSVEYMRQDSQGGEDDPASRIVEDELRCDCGADQCGPGAQAAAQDGATFRRGSYDCLCSHLAGLELPMRRAAGVPLAWVGLGLNGCNELEFSEPVDACGPRRLVKRNDMLFDLVRGADLTRISGISWGQLIRAPQPVPWQAFYDFFDLADGTTGFTVMFSGPVQPDTITADCFVMTMLTADASGWEEPRRVPLVGVLPGASHDDDPAGSTRSVTLVVDHLWAQDELSPDKRESICSRGTLRIEIEVRGDFILDLCGQAIDASARGAQALPSGNGAPGGRFLSVFRVQPRSRPNNNAKGSQQ